MKSPPRGLLRFAASIAVVASFLLRTSGVSPDSSPVRWAIALFDYPQTVIIDPFGVHGRPVKQKFDFIVKWVSADGAWIGGKSEVDLFRPGPDCLHVQHLVSMKKYTYCGLARQVESFAFSNDLKLLAVLGEPRTTGGFDGALSLSLIHLTHPEKPVVIIPGDLRSAYVSGLSFTADGRWLTFSQDGNVFSFDTGSEALKRLASGSRPARSPTSTHLVYEDPEGWLMLLDLTTNVQTSIGATTGVGASWSPDGERVVYTRPIQDAAGNNAEVLVYNVKSGRSEAVGRVYTLGDRYWWVLQ